MWKITYNMLDLTSKCSLYKNIAGIEDSIHAHPFTIFNLVFSLHFLPFYILILLLNYGKMMLFARISKFYHFTSFKEKENAKEHKNTNL